MSFDYLITSWKIINSVSNLKLNNKEKVKKNKDKMLKKPLFNNFLGCMTLESGGKLIAWLSIVFGILGILGKILSEIKSDVLSYESN
jgi:hypothetical protein